LAFKLKNEVKVGILVVASSAFLYWGFNFLKGRNYLSNNRIFYAKYDQVNGLVKANWVMVNGVKVGEVSGIEFIDAKGRVLVEMSVENAIDIPINSIARIYNSDVLGSKAIELILGDSMKLNADNKLEPVLAENGDTLTSEIQPSITEEVSVQMLPIKLKAENVMASLDSVLAVIQYVFNEDTRDNLAHSFESIKFTIKNLENTTYNLDTLVSTQRNRLAQIFANIESISSNIKNSNSKLTNIINNFSSLSDSLAKVKIATTINNANTAISNFSEITAKINNGEGSLGLLINNDTLYNQLEKSSKDLDLLLEDLRLNPQRYVQVSVFGKSSKKNQYTAPEDKK
jgi:phospholipid/cholesterol/gamma-HCH transport system substrate-binding protein